MSTNVIYACLRLKSYDYVHELKSNEYLRGFNLFEFNKCTNVNRFVKLMNMLRYKYVSYKMLIKKKIKFVSWLLFLPPCLLWIRLH